MPHLRDVFARKGLLSLLVDAEMASTIREDLDYQRSRDRKEKGRLIAGRWLRGYAYHVPLGGSVFLLALTVTMGLALLTVGRQTLKTARVNPARCVKYE